MEERLLKLEDLVKDEAKVVEIFGGAAEDAYAKLQANGIDLTQEEFNSLMTLVKAGREGNDLSEEELAAVAGGCGGCYDFFNKVGKVIDKLLQTFFG